jgi:hypothetical protein
MRSHTSKQEEKGKKQRNKEFHDEKNGIKYALV